MARARNIKPGFFANEDLAELPFSTRLLFIGLWTLADREGRLEDRPKRIKMAIFPADNVEVEDGLCALASFGFIDRYEVNGTKVISITSWHKHQAPHHTEKASTLPDKNGALTVKAPLDNGAKTVYPQKQDGGNLPDSLIPDSLIHSVANATGPAGAAPPVDKSESQEDQSKRELYEAGKSLLQSRGMPKPQCGSFIGKLSKDYGQAVALEAVRAAVAAQPMDAAEYLKATCQRLKGERREPLTVESKEAERTAEYLRQREEQAKLATPPPASLLEVRNRIAQGKVAA